MNATIAQITALEQRARAASTSLADGQRLCDDAQRLREGRGGTSRSAVLHATALLRN